MTNRRETDGDNEGLTRRSVLRAGAVTTGALAMPATLAASGPTRRGRTKVMVVLFQRGGADHLNIYAPTGAPEYATLRPTVGVQPPNSTAGVVGLPMDQTFSMHPLMAGTHAAFTAPNSTCAVVHAVGYQPPSRSHFESMDLYETALGGQFSGWINRHLQVTATPNDPPVRALALRSSLPKSMVGRYPCFAVSNTAELAYPGDPDPDVLAVHEAIVASTATGGMLPAQQLAYQSQQDTFGLLDSFSVLDPYNYTPANGAQYPATELGDAMRQIAEVIKAQLGVEIFAVSQGGWDHHSALVASIAANLSNLDAAVTAFFDDLGALAQDVVLVTMSEFGRTVAENGSAGTDHGVGGAMTLRGGAVNGGQVHGSWPGLSPGALVGGNALAASNDFRDVLREVLEVHMGGTDPAVVFPGRVYQPIGVL